MAAEKLLSEAACKAAKAKASIYYLNNALDFVFASDLMAVGRGYIGIV